MRSNQRRATPETHGLHKALDRARVPNRFVALTGGHGEFSAEEWTRGWRDVWLFLDPLQR